jgi:hypothetical protein
MLVGAPPGMVSRREGHRCLAGRRGTAQQIRERQTECSCRSGRPCASPTPVFRVALMIWSSKGRTHAVRLAWNDFQCAPLTILDDRRTEAPIGTIRSLHVILCRCTSREANGRANDARHCVGFRLADTFVGVAWTLPEVHIQSGLSRVRNSGHTTATPLLRLGVSINTIRMAWIGFHRHYEHLGRG